VILARVFDTEVADCFTNQPRLSLIQVATTSDVMVDVLDRSALVAEFITAVMMASSIEKVYRRRAKLSVSLTHRGIC
jgi:ribonuclease D